ncbi:MAG: hypothetical protein O3B47_00850 [bacterium]|nr:hypothetical protein [bacterium]
MAETQRTVTIIDRRAEGEEAARGTGRHYGKLLLQKGLTVDAIGTDALPLGRETDKRDAVIAAVREESAKMANFTVTEKPDEVVKEPVAPASKESSLDEAGTRKVRALFESAEAGYNGYALELLRKGKIDPDNLPEGSAPLWESPEAALNELLANLTPAVLEKIDSDVTSPAIVIEPIMSHEAVYVKDHETTDYDRRVVGDTPFYVSEWAAKDLNNASQRNKVGSTDGQRIVGWCIGVADKAQVTKTLESDGDVSAKTLEDRAKDFHGERGHGTLGFVSAVDRPVLYGLMMNQSRSEYTNNPVDNVQEKNGVWTMGTRVDNSGQYPRVAGGLWNGRGGRASLYEDSADCPDDRARVRLAVMFNKS